MSRGDHDDRTAGERTRERILECALPLFAIHGYAGASVRMIAKAADVNVATLAYHFADKDGLYRATIEQMYVELSHIDVGDVLSRPGDPLDNLVIAAWRFARAHRQQVHLLHRHLLDSGRHHEVLEDHWSAALLARTDPLFAMLRPDWDATDRRLLVFSVLHLVVRFVLDDPAQLRHGLAVAEDADLDRVVCAWLASLMRARLAA